MKKRISLLLALALLLPAAAAFAAVPGEAIGDVLYTDVVATIDGCPIRSYNIAGETYVVVEDLAEYGFSVSWLPDDGKLVIDPVHASTPDTYTAEYVPEKNTHPAGTPAMKYLYTEITTWIGERQIVGYNIGGFTCCRMDDLAEAFAETYVWDPATITLNMTTKAENSAEAGTSEQDLTSDKAEEVLADEAEHVPAVEAFVAEYIQSLQDAMRFQIRGNADEPLYIAQKAVLDSFTYSILSYVSVPERSSRTKTVYIELQPAGYGSYTFLEKMNIIVEFQSP